MILSGPTQVPKLGDYMLSTMVSHTRIAKEVTIMMPVTTEYSPDANGR